MHTYLRLLRFAAPYKLRIALAILCMGLLSLSTAAYANLLGPMLEFLFTGSVIAWMTRRQRLSKLIIAATALVILGGSVILWVCRVNVRQVLQKWEQMEKR